MSRKVWREILEQEIARWSSQSYEQLLAGLPELRVYEVRRGAEVFQVEAEILIATADYVQVSIAVDDGVLPGALVPASGSFVVRRGPGQQGAR